MSEDDEIDTTQHDRQVAAVTDAVARLLPRLAGQRFTPEAIFEGAVRGGAVAIMAATPAGAADVAELLEAMADAFRDLGQPALRVVDSGAKAH